MIRPNLFMDEPLTPIVAALADLSDTELAALIAATYGVPQIAPRLLAWIDDACDWELNQRESAREVSAADAEFLRVMSARGTRCERNACVTRNDA